MSVSRAVHLIVAALVVAAIIATPMRLAAQAITFANPGFEVNWRRYDEPVQAGQANRSWTWGPTSNAILTEPYAESPGGQRQVQYFDKARMELNNPANAGGVTNGLLVREMVGGFLAVGDAATQPSSPARQVVAGDPVASNPNGPTYLTFNGVASLNNDRRAADRTGQRVDQSITQAGLVGASTTGQLIYAFYEPTLGHNIPDVLWAFLNQSGPVYFPADGQIGQANRVYDPWQTVMGLPITEPYWTTTNLAGVPTTVLVQLFERRVLTYTPSNPPSSQVEMGNVGQAYYAWRYQSPQPTPTPAPTQAGFTSGPEHGVLTTTTAELTWRTNVPTTNEVEWGLSPDRLDRRSGDATTYRTNHDVTLGGLNSGTVYYWRVNAAVQAGGPNLVSGIHSFQTTTPALPPTATATPVPAGPAFTDAPRPSVVTNVSATLVWGTNVPTTSEIDWGTDSANPNQRAGATAFATSHQVTLSGLTPGTVYYWRVNSGLQSGGQRLVSAVLTFQTTSPSLPPTPTPTATDPAADPIIVAGPAVQNLTATGGTVYWRTNVATSAEVAWGTSAESLTQRVSVTTPATSHNVALSSLTPNTTYYYRAFSSTQAGKSVSSAILSFRTPAQ